MNSDVLKNMPSSRKVDKDELIEILQKKKLRVGVYPVAEEKWIDVGQWKEYNSAVESGWRGEKHWIMIKI